MFRHVTCSAAECPSHACEFEEDRDLRAKENKDAQRLTREGCARRLDRSGKQNRGKILIRLSEFILACLSYRNEQRDVDARRSLT
jgi:hypothetical protein